MVQELTAVVIGGVISCLDLSGIQNYSNESSSSHWEYVACQKLLTNYENVVLRPLKITETDIVDSYSTSTVNVSDPRAGRLKVSWSEYREQKRKVQVTVYLSFDAYKSVWVFAKPKKAGVTLSDQDVVLKNLNVAPFVGVKDFINVFPSGKKLTKNSNSGQIVFSEYLAEPALIKKNESIKAIVIVEGLKIEMDAIAMEDVYEQNQKIKIISPSSNTVLTGIFKGNSTVYVED